MTTNEAIDRYKRRLQAAERSIERAMQAICDLSGDALSEDRRALDMALTRVGETIHSTWRLYDNPDIRLNIDEKKAAVRKGFTVSMAVDGRIDVMVEAKTVQEAFEKAKDAFMEEDLSDMETVDAKPVNATDDETGELTDYE